MRLWLALAVVATIALLTVVAFTPAEGRAPAGTTQAICPTERASVKTLSDPDAGLVDFTPQDSTVHDLAALPRPQALPPDNRIPPTEETTFRLTAYLREMKLEADGDISVVLIDPNADAQVRIEFPDTGCSPAAQSPHEAAMAAARQGFINLYGQPSADHSTLIEGVVIVTGVGFFDSLHGERGAALNGIELHPVLSFDWPISITPSPVPTPTGTPTPIPTDLPLCDVLPPLTPAPGCAGTPTPTKTPTRSPLFQTLYWGDLDCSGAVNALDSLVALALTEAFAPRQTTPCPRLGEGVMVGGQLRGWGFIDCAGISIYYPAMDLLLHAAGLDYARTADCPDAGDLVEVVSHPF
jgi:hypothetical protein